MERGGCYKVTDEIIWHLYSARGGMQTKFSRPRAVKEELTPCVVRGSARGLWGTNSPWAGGMESAFLAAMLNSMSGHNN
jgi:hypothetical protein